jgi:hypothetical protein
MTIRFVLRIGVLFRIAQSLDDWMVDQNVVARRDGLLTLKPCIIRVLGQAALFEAKLDLELAQTKDVDVLADYQDAVRREFERLLAKEGRELDPLGHEIWMPRETRYSELFNGKLVRVLVAEPEAVMVSKALKAPAKNGPLITEYIASGASSRFFDLATKYAVNLEQFI